MQFGSCLKIQHGPEEAKGTTVKQGLYPGNHTVSVSGRMLLHPEMEAALDVYETFNKRGQRGALRIKVAENM